MKTAIYCPGPSLAAAPFKKAPGYTCSIAVNRAILLVPCAFWALYDEITFMEARPAHRPVLLCPWKTESILRVRNRAQLEDHAFIPSEWVRRAVPASIGWQNFSFTSAIALAIALGATEIDCFGADWTAEAPDWDGVQIRKGGRTSDRFAAEKSRFEALVKFAETKNCSLQRI
jgi:hypothetical protein